MALKFESFFPQIPKETEMMMLQGMTYKTTLTFPKDVGPGDIEVQAWTSQCDRFNPEGHWHALDLFYLGPDSSGLKHEYGVTEVITSDKDFCFTFRAKFSVVHCAIGGWVWSHNFGENGFARVLPCRTEDKWTQEPNYDHICGALYLGNFIAATHAKECGFTHVLNVAENLDVVFPHKDVVYHKVFVKDGAHNPIEDDKLLDSVYWITKHDSPENKILLNCRAGIGRAGSVAVAYVYYTHPAMSYKDAYDYCFNKRYVYPHSQLRHSIERLFPRNITFVYCIPGIPSWNYMFMLEAMTYKAAVKIPYHLYVGAESLDVYAWTNQVDRHQSDGQWHRLRLTYIEQDKTDEDLHLYGVSEIITGDKDFNFTFCLQSPSTQEVQWCSRFGEDGFSHVEPPRQYDNWTLGPDYTHVLGAVHVGNFLAATNAEECGITHVLNVADNLDMVYPSAKVTYRKISMSDGAHNPVSTDKIRNAVEWLKLHDKTKNKVLVNCRAGIGRAGSVGVAFVFACQTSWSYEDAYQHVFSKRFVYPHAGLREVLYMLYPRTH